MSGMGPGMTSAPPQPPQLFGSQRVSTHCVPPSEAPPSGWQRVSGFGQPRMHSPKMQK